MVYPQTDAFKTELHYRFFDGLPLICLPFDVAHPVGPQGQRATVDSGALEDLPVPRMSRRGGAFRQSCPDGGPPPSSNPASRAFALPIHSAVLTSSEAIVLRVRSSAVTPLFA